MSARSVTPVVSVLLAALLAACASGPKATNAVQADMPMQSTSVAAGAGSSVTMKGNPLPLGGSGMVEVGKPLPGGTVLGADLKPVNLAAGNGKVRIINVVPSVDTPTCDRQTHELSEKNGGLDQQVELITVSRDLPFAQQRFAKDAKIRNVTFVSDYNMREFGNANGLEIAPLALLARAVIVVDRENVVRYLQVVPEVTALPDMQAAMRAARGLL
jgi:thiol peroxidase